MNLRDLKIGTRLGAGFALILLAAGAMLGGTMLGYGSSRDALLATLQDTSLQESQISAMRRSLLYSALAVRSMGLQSTVEGVQKDEAEAKRQRAAYLAERGKLEAGGLDAAEREMFVRLGQIDAQMDKDFKEAVELAAQFNAEQAAKVILTRIDPLLSKANAVLDDFAKLQVQHSAAAVADANSRNARMVAGIGLAALVVLGAVAALAWRLTVSITAPLHLAVASAARVARGDLVSDIPVSGHDEATQLLEALREMRGSLAGMVREVRQGTDAIDTASNEIAQGNADLSARTESQASALQQTASSVEHLTETVKHNADSADQALKLSRTATTQADQGHAVVSEVISTMGAINEHSRKISDITAVINSIAFQTNILALNAAVEAARAGEQGRGFAVVAGEVRNLAQRSAEAAREIKGLIGSSVEKVEAGARLVGDAGVTMTDIVTQVKRVSDLISEISAATIEQTSGIGQVNQAVALLDQSTQQNAALVEQSAAAADSLRQQALALSDVVSVFRLQAV